MYLYYREIIFNIVLTLSNTFRHFPNLIVELKMTNKTQFVWQKSKNSRHDATLYLSVKQRSQVYSFRFMLSQKHLIGVENMGHQLSGRDRAHIKLLNTLTNSPISNLPCRFFIAHKLGWRIIHPKILWPPQIRQSQHWITKNMRDSRLYTLCPKHRLVKSIT